MRSKPLGVVTIYCSFIFFFAKYIAVVSTYDNALTFFSFFILYFLQQMPNNYY